MASWFKLGYATDLPILCQRDLFTSRNLDGQPFLPGTNDLVRHVNIQSAFLVTDKQSLVWRDRRELPLLRSGSLPVSLEFFPCCPIGSHNRHLSRHIRFFT